VRRIFSDFLDLAGLGESGITMPWYRHTGAMVIARGAAVDADGALLALSLTGAESDLLAVLDDDDIDGDIEDEPRDPRI
jgi:hypothetical protein